MLERTRLTARRSTWPLGVAKDVKMNDHGAITGFDAYELAWDAVAKQLWSVLVYNVVWFAGLLLGTLGLFLLCVTVLENWGWFCASSAVLLLFSLPLWEGANILRYGAQDGVPEQPRTLPVVAIIVARLLFILVVTPAYLFFLLPGIYVHSRLALYLPVLLRSTTPNPLESLSQSWLLSRTRFVQLYSLWIVMVVSQPVSLLPFGLGLILRQPVNALAKDIMFFSCSNRPRDRPTEVERVEVKRHPDMTDEPFKQKEEPHG